MKKRYNLMLEEDAVKVVKAFCRTTKVSFSGFVNAILVEWAKTMEGQPSPLEKPIGQMTIQEFGEVMNYWMKALQE